MSPAGARQRRAFRPALDDGPLEGRLLMSALKELKYPPARQSSITLQTGDGGAKQRVIDRTGQIFDLDISTGPGTVKATHALDGRINVVVYGSTELTELDINPIARPTIHENGHNFAFGTAGRSGLINIASITVQSGQIGSILGYHTAELSGPVLIGGNGTVDRLAFDKIDPGGSIKVGGTLNTLDILNNANFVGTPGIQIGRDLNSMNVGTDLTFQQGAQLNIGRYLGLTPQGAKGTGPAGQGALVTGSLAIGPTSSIVINGTLNSLFLVQGSGSGITRISLPGGIGPLGGFIFRNGFTP